MNFNKTDLAKEIRKNAEALDLDEDQGQERLALEGES